MNFLVNAMDIFTKQLPAAFVKNDLLHILFLENFQKKPGQHMLLRPFDIGFI